MKRLADICDIQYGYAFDSKCFTEDSSYPQSALNDWVFNEDTIKEVLHIFMTNGIKVDYGNKIGKSIIFAKNHEHAEKIYEIFGKEYPHLVGYAKVIDNYLNYSQSAIDEFSDPKKLPQIAISVDMLDTGIDVPEVVNLVFFKKVMSKAKFWQMIGRGTRLCPGLLDGEDKDKFYIFDFCGNFEFFRMSKGRPTATMIGLQGAIFQLEFEIAYKLQDIVYQTERLIAYRKALVNHMTTKVKELNRENFAVRQHLKYVDIYANESNYVGLTYEDKAEYYVRQHQDNEAIAKLKSNQPLTSEDIKNLENIMWSEIGTKQDYEAEYGEKPLGEFVREIVGLDMTAAKEAFAEYLDETNLDSRQIYFVNQIVEFIVHNGMMKDLSVLQEPPFTDQGSIVEVFTDLSVWMGIRKAIEQVNANALAA